MEGVLYFHDKYWSNRQKDLHLIKMTSLYNFLNFFRNMSVCSNIIWKKMTSVVILWHLYASVYVLISSGFFIIIIIIYYAF